MSCSSGQLHVGSHHEETLETGHNFEPSGGNLDINAFHGAFPQANKFLLGKTAKRFSKTLEGNLLGCEGCLTAKGLERPYSQHLDDQLRGAPTTK